MRLVSAWWIPTAGAGVTGDNIMTNRYRGRAQSFLEYALIVSVVSAALVMMSLYVRRAVSANLNMIEQQVNIEAIR